MITVRDITGCPEYAWNFDYIVAKEVGDKYVFRAACANEYSAEAIALEVGDGIVISNKKDE